MRWPRQAALGALLCALLWTPSSLAAAPPAAAQTPGLEPLEHPVWLCRPGLPDNPCNQDAAGNPQRVGPGGEFVNSYVSGDEVTLDATRVPADGATSVEPYDPPSSPPVDCFYVYPTVDVLPNPLLQTGSTPPTPQDQHMGATLGQASRFADLCRLFVPVYRQVPLPILALAVLTGLAPDPLPGLIDVDQAWMDYWENDNVDPATGQRRGVVLIGHSQGSANLIRLIQNRIDGNPAMQDQIVSALLLGSDVTVPFDQPAGGGDDLGSTFQYLPACERPSPAAPVPTGCVVAYNSYAQAEGQPPVPGSLFGRSTVEEHKVLCTNPAALLSGTPAATTPLDMYLGTQELYSGNPLYPGGVLGPLLTGYPVPDYPTGYARYPDSIEGQCRFVEDAGGNWSWLQVSDNEDLFSPLFAINPLGLHVVDYSLALGDLHALVAAQSQAWLQQ